MMPMKISGSHVSMKFLTSSKNDELGDFVAVSGVAGTEMFCVFAPSRTRTTSSPACRSAASRALSLVGNDCAQPPTAGVTQNVTACAEAGTASAATTVARAIATRRRRSTEGMATAVIHDANRQAGAQALPPLVGPARVCACLCSGDPFEPWVGPVLAAHLGARSSFDQHHVS